MRTIIIALAVAAFASGSAAASDQTDAMVVVHKWADAFNKGDSKTGIATCAEDAIIIDDFSPHVWQGSGACAKWYKDYGAFAAKSEVTDPNVSVGKARHLDVESGYAYLVSPTNKTRRLAYHWMGLGGPIEIERPSLSNPNGTDIRPEIASRECLRISGGFSGHNARSGHLDQG